MAVRFERRFELVENRSREDFSTTIPASLDGRSKRTGAGEIAA